MAGTRTSTYHQSDLKVLLIQTGKEYPTYRIEATEFETVTGSTTARITSALSHVLGRFNNPEAATDSVAHQKSYRTIEWWITTVLALPSEHPLWEAIQ